MVVAVVVCQVHGKQPGASQASSSTLPEMIDDSEEAERVAGMMQRDSLVRGLGVFELVRRLIKSVDKNDPTSAVFASNVDSSTGGATTVDRPPSNHVSLFTAFDHGGSRSSWQEGGRYCDVGV